MNEEGTPSDMVDITPKCGQLKGDHLCTRQWFHEGAHLADDGTQWAPGESDDLGWTARYGMTRPMTPGETLKAIRGDDDDEDDAAR
jgi:hypothetical protein